MTADWPAAMYPEWPVPPGPDAGFDTIKAYAQTAMMADFILSAAANDVDLPEESRPTREQAWVMAENHLRSKAPMLPPPLLHPLDMWLLMPAWRCPVCTERFNYSPGTELVTAFRGDRENWDRVQPGWVWEFQPCGCVGRVVPGKHDEAPTEDAGA